MKNFGNANSLAIVGQRNHMKINTLRIRRKRMRILKKMKNNVRKMKEKTMEQTGKQAEFLQLTLARKSMTGVIREIEEIDR